MNEIDAAVGRRIKQRRKEMGLSQTELADAIGVKFQQVQKYESGANRVAASRLWEISEALDVPVTYFFQDLQRREPKPANLAGDPTSSELGVLINKVPPAQKKALLSLIHTFQPHDDTEQPE